MENFIETLISEKDLFNGSLKRTDYEIDFTDSENEIHLEYSPGRYVATQSINICSLIFDLYIDIAKFNEFYYVKCFSNFPSKYNGILIAIIKRSLMKKVLSNENILSRYDLNYNPESIYKFYS
jgi:hypothetical protein